MQKLTKKGGGDIGLCDENRIYGCLIETWVFLIVIDSLAL